MQGCTEPPFFEKHHIAPPNFEQSIVNATKDHFFTILSEFPFKLCTPGFILAMHTLLYMLCTCCAHAGYILETYWLHAGNMLTTCWPHSSHQISKYTASQLFLVNCPFLIWFRGILNKHDMPRKCCKEIFFFLFQQISLNMKLLKCLNLCLWKSVGKNFMIHRN